MRGEGGACWECEGVAVEDVKREILTSVRSLASCARRRMRWELVALFFCVLAISTSMSLIRSMIPMVAGYSKRLSSSRTKRLRF